MRKLKIYLWLFSLACALNNCSDDNSVQMTTDATEGQETETPDDTPDVGILKLETVV